MPSLILTTLREDALQNKLRERSCVVAQIAMNPELRAALDVLDLALKRNPPTSLSKAASTWLPQAQELATQLSAQLVMSGLSLDWNEIPDRFDTIFIGAERIVPIDLLPCRGSLLGSQCIIAHTAATKEEDICSNLLESLKERKLTLRRLAHVCTYFAGSTSLHEMDVIAATLRIDNRLAIEHYFYPSEEISAGLFRRRDLDILHFECHGQSTLLQIDNPYGTPQDVRNLYDNLGPRVYFFLGCEAGQDIDSVAPAFARMGAQASVGSYCRFLSGGDSGEVRTSSFYDELYMGLIHGRSLGDALKEGKLASGPERIYYCAWLLFGSPRISFSPLKFGARHGF